MILIGVLILILDLAWFWYPFLFQCCIAVLLPTFLFPYYIAVILLPFPISIWYCCDFATFSHLNTIYLYIIWFWCDFDMISWLRHLLNPLRLSPFNGEGFDVPMKKPRKLRQAQGRWRCSRCKAGLDTNNEPIVKGDGAALEQGRWRGRNMDYRRSVKITQSK